MTATRHSRLRAFWVQVHLWLGLTLVVIGALLGLSGCVLVYDHEIEARLRPQRYEIGGTQPALRFSIFMLGVVGVVAGASDIRMIRAGGLGGASRIARHLRRICFALLIAAMAFFLGQPGVFPKALRTPVPLALPVLAVFLCMLYWLWRSASKEATGPSSTSVREEDSHPHASSSRTPSSPKCASPLTRSATATDSETENSASRRPIVLSITANVEMQGT